MNIFTSGGHDARRAYAYALRLELGIPIGGMTPSSIHFASVSGLDRCVLQAAAQKIAADRKDCVIAVYADDRAHTPERYVLLLLRPNGVEAITVVPAAIGDDRPIVLMDEDCSRQFAVNERGILEDRSIDAATRRARGHRRAAARIADTAEILGPLLCTGGPLPGDVFLDSRGIVTTVRSAAA